MGLLVASGSAVFAGLSIPNGVDVSTGAEMVGLGVVAELFHPCADGAAAALFGWNVGCGLKAAGLVLVTFVPSDWQDEQLRHPVSARPTHIALTIPSTGFLPIAFPFPCMRVRSPR